MASPTDYQSMHDALSQEPSPDPNSFMHWLFTSGILTSHQLDLIRAKMSNPSLTQGGTPSGLTAPPGTAAGTGAAIVAQGARGGAAAPSAKPGTPPQATASAPVSGPPTGGLPSTAQPRGQAAPAGGQRPLKVGAAVGQM